MYEEWTKVDRQPLLKEDDVTKLLNEIGKKDVLDFMEKYLYRTQNATDSDMHCQKISVYVFSGYQASQPLDISQPVKSDTAC